MDSGYWGCYYHSNCSRCGARVLVEFGSYSCKCEDIEDEDLDEWLAVNEPDPDAEYERWRDMKEDREC